MLRHVVAGERRALKVGATTAADCIVAKTLERWWQRLNSKRRNRKWLLAIVKLDREHLVSVEVQHAPRFHVHNTPSQLRSVVCPHVVVSPLIDPSVRGI